MFAAQPADAAPMPELPAGFSIAAPGRGEPFRAIRPCGRAQSGEIVVCGRRDDSPYRLRRLPPSQAAPPDPGIPFGTEIAPGARLGLVVDQVEFPGGLISRRVMISLRQRF